MIYVILIIITIFAAFILFIIFFGNDNDHKSPPTPLFDRIDLYAVRGKHLTLLQCAKSELISESYTLKKVDISLLKYDFAICDKETKQVHFYKFKNTKT